jgi:hypothetical protein
LSHHHGAVDLSPTPASSVPVGSLSFLYFQAKGKTFWYLPLISIISGFLGFEF